MFTTLKPGANSIVNSVDARTSFTTLRSNDTRCRRLVERQAALTGVVGVGVARAGFRSVHFCYGADRYRNNSCGAQT